MTKRAASGESSISKGADGRCHGFVSMSVSRAARNRAGGRGGLSLASIGCSEEREVLFEESTLEEPPMYARVTTY